MAPLTRPKASWRFVGLGLLAVLVLAGAITAAAQQFSYTVQVVALSDTDSALTIQRDLLRQGYPAYVVRSTSPEGAVFRVRVGAFANRPAALLYAMAMPQVAGGQPVPALAEGIPQGVTPLAPRLVYSQDLMGLDARFVRVGGKLALRTQQRTPLAPAEYTVMAAGAVEQLRAWHLHEEEDGSRVLVRDMYLWPETWQEESSEVLEGFQTSLVTLVAERLGLDQATVRAARYGVTAGVPRLIVVERVVPGSADEPELLGLGLPAAGMTPTGPLQYLGLAEELPSPPEGVRVDLASGSVSGALAPAPSPVEPEPSTEPETAPNDAAGADDDADANDDVGADGDEATPEPEAQPDEGAASGAGAIVGDGWLAEPDGPFVRLTIWPAVEGVTTSSWRAALGTPLWSYDGYLVAYEGTTVLVYDFLPRD